MRTPILVLVVALALTGQVAHAVCNSEDANVPSWTSVNYTAVLYGDEPVCATGTNLRLANLQVSVADWNAIVGKNLFAVPDCSTPYVGIAVADAARACYVSTLSSP